MIQLRLTNLLKLGCIVVKSNISRNGFSTVKSKPPWNVMFFGTDDFSLNSLKLLNIELKKGFYINRLEVVTSFKAKNNPVFKYSTDEKLQVHDWPLVERHSNYDFGIVVSFGHLIPKIVIDYFQYGILNVHASLLPRWRGAAPIIHAIANEDTKTGITIMRIHPEKFDIGDIVMQKSVDIPENILMPELYHTLAELGAKTLMQTLYSLPKSLENSKPQPNIGVTHAPKVTSQMGVIDFEKMTARKIYATARSLYGLFPLQTKWKSNVVKLYDVNLVNNTNDNLILRTNVVPGLVIYDKKNEQILVCCAEHTFISVRRIGIVGKKPMTAKEFNNGYVKKEIIENRMFLS